VAVVDDEAPVRTALRRLLRLADYEVVAFASGEDFLASLAERRPDCVVLDIHMPGLTGLEVQTRLSAAQLKIPVLFITASDELALSEQVLLAGGTQLLRKPFSNLALLEALGGVLSRGTGAAA
jgi:FixJ family two-component response regulator